MIFQFASKAHSMTKRGYVKLLFPTEGDVHRPTKTYIWRWNIKLHRGDNAYVLILRSRFLRSEITIQVYHKDRRGVYLEYSHWRVK